MSSTYTTRYGIDWPIEMSEVLIDLTVAKKHRQLTEQGFKIKDPWEALLKACRTLLSKSQFNISPWTEEHAHDFVMENRAITWGCGSSSKSNDYGLFALLDWMTDPIATLWLVGSTTKLDLRSRTWESIARYYATLSQESKYFLIPGKLSEISLEIRNVVDPNIPETVGSKAGIKGVALNEDGRLQGAHLPYVRVLVDELATIRDHESLGTGVANLLIGTTDFRFYGLANPEGWDHVSSQYCLPEKDNPVTVDTGYWRSTRGYFVRHHDGAKSPCVLDPGLTDEYPYLMTKAQYEENLREADGNEDAPKIWKMVRGFPSPAGTTVPTVLDPLVAAANNCGMALEQKGRDVRGSAMGIDPAWSEGGDDAVAARPDIVMVLGKPTLDFTGKVFKMPISASSPLPVTQQQRNAVLKLLHAPDGPSLYHTAVDSSGNQGLADDLDMFVGGGCLHVNNAVRASENPIRAAGDVSPARDKIYDRGTEAWEVLAEFCRAGQVRGLPPEALQALCSRRYATHGRTGSIRFPNRLEPKDDFAKRFKGSPNEADACALAALAVKERMGIMPFGHLPPPSLDNHRPTPDVRGAWGQHQGDTSRYLDQVFAPGEYEPEFGELYEEAW